MIYIKRKVYTNVGCKQLGFSGSIRLYVNSGTEGMVDAAAIQCSWKKCQQWIFNSWSCPYTKLQTFVCAYVMQVYMYMKRLLDWVVILSTSPAKIKRIDVKRCLLGPLKYFVCQQPSFHPSLGPVLISASSIRDGINEVHPVVRLALYTATRSQSSIHCVKCH